MLIGLEALEVLREEFPDAEIGIKGLIPYARLPDGRLFGCLFGYPEGNGWSPVAIIQFDKGLDNFSYTFYKWIVNGDWDLYRDDEPWWFPWQLGELSE